MLAGLSALSAIAGGGATAQVHVGAAAPSFTSCRLKHIDVPVRCAQFAVPSDHSVATSARIQVHVAIVPSLARRPEPDPVYFFAGGPGQAASDLGALVTALSDLRKKREVILVDQRGTGRSKTLTCDLGDDGQKDAVATALKANDADVQQQWQRCIATLKGDAAHHRTDDYIDDLEAVRRALGHARINVWGGSYGSRVALRYMKRYPAVIRSVVLDGVAPTSLRLPDDALASSDAALRETLAACAASVGCNEAYPDALGSYDRLLASLRSTPRDITLAHPATGRPITIRLTDRTVMALVWPLLYQPQGARLLPALIGEASRGNVAPLIATLTAGGAADAEIAVAMRFAVMCAEDMLGRSAAPSARFQSLSELFYGFCKHFPAGKVAPEFFEPTTSTIPTLLLSGSLDPVTPPAQAALAARSLGQSKHVVVEGVGHIASALPCPRRMIAKFVDAGRIDAARDACEADLNSEAQKRRPLFYVSTMEARP